MNKENFTNALRILWPFISKKCLKRKHCAIFAVTVLTLGELFPEYNMISKILAGACATGNAIDLKPKERKS